MAADGGLTVIDGAQLRSPDLRLPIPGGAATGARIAELADSEAAARLFGMSLPESLRSAALRRLDAGGDTGFLSSEFGNSESKIREYILALADGLKDDPLVISVLDGSVLRIFLDDEDDFAMLAENLFTDLDVDDKGKINRNEIRNALVHMGVVMGVPPFTESGDLLDSILKKHGVEGGEQLGQAQFAQLLQPILQDLADALAEKHVAVLQNIKVNNGSKLKKLLDDNKHLEDVIDVMFQEWDATGNGDGNKKLQSFLEAKGLKLGLPQSDSNEAVALYDQIFSSVNEGKITAELSRVTFREVVKDIFKMFAEQLEANPVFMELES